MNGHLSVNDGPAFSFLPFFKTPHAPAVLLHPGKVSPSPVKNDDGSGQKTAGALVTASVVAPAPAAVTPVSLPSAVLGMLVVTSPVPVP